ncbi:putative apyrase 6 [Senna tora]|uniref:Putative apyrase 6 n=1 Tax=Senna tora TaxID=362788 RepID=A0A834TU03_9FABA|nr:putative apyrase 6 [Senna tora]
MTSYKHPQPSCSHKPNLRLSPSLLRDLTFPELQQIHKRLPGPVWTLGKRRKARIHFHRRQPIRPKIKERLPTFQPVPENVDSGSAAPSINNNPVPVPHGIAPIPPGKEGVEEKQSKRNQNRSEQRGVEFSGVIGSPGEKTGADWRLNWIHAFGVGMEPSAVGIRAEEDDETKVGVVVGGGGGIGDGAEGNHGRARPLPVSVWACAVVGADSLGGATSLSPIGRASIMVNPAWFRAMPMALAPYKIKKLVISFIAKITFFFSFKI